MGKAQKKRSVQQFSDIISGFLSMMETAKKDHEWNYAEVNRMDYLTQDYLHKLELEKLSYQERAKIATALKRCRKARRASKDTVEILSPLVSFLESERGKTLINLTHEILGQTRKIEAKMGTRTYFPRVLKENEKS